jgi:hypothetical protein
VRAKLFVAMGVLFIGLGVYLLMGASSPTACTDPDCHRSTRYHVSGLRRRSVQSIYLSSLSALRLEERGDGNGTIYFADQPSHWHVAYGPGEAVTYLK